MIVSVQGVSFAYGSVPVLEDVTFTVADGEMVALLGPNGTGKTTLLRTLNGILARSGGTVLLDGHESTRCSRRDIARFFGYVPQRGEMLRLTVFDAVLLGRRPHLGWTVEERDLEKVGAALEALALEPLALRYLDELSGGEFQKVLIARALVQEPKMLLLDEPTSSLDLKNQMDILATLKHVVRGHGMSALASLHDLNTALRFADRLLLLRGGIIMAACTPDELTSATIEAVYDVPVDILRYRGIPMVVPL